MARYMTILVVLVIFGLICCPQVTHASQAAYDMGGRKLLDRKTLQARSLTFGFARTNANAGALGDNTVTNTYTSTTTTRNSGSGTVKAGSLATSTNGVARSSTSGSVQAAGGTSP